MSRREERYQGSEDFQLRNVWMCRHMLLSGSSESVCSISPHHLHHTLQSSVWLPVGGGNEKAVNTRLHMSIQSNMSLRCGFRHDLEIRRITENKTHFTQFFQWNSNSSRAVFDLMFLSFLEIVTSDTLEDLPYKV